jgi:heme-degrading monooxygenase HmoA
MYARFGTIHVQGSMLDQAVSSLEKNAIPTVKKQKGFKNIYILADRPGGHIRIISLWESAEALHNWLNSAENATMAALVRSESGGESAAPTWEEYEVTAQG